MGKIRGSDARGDELLPLGSRDDLSFALPNSNVETRRASSPPPTGAPHAEGDAARRVSTSHFLPTHLFPQSGYVSYVMASVPRIECEGFFQRQQSHFRMTEGAFPVGVGDVPQHHAPALVQGIEQGERDLYRGL